MSNSTEFKEAKGVNKYVVAKISDNKYKDVLLNKRCLTHSMNRTKSQNHRIGTNEINTISLSCSNGKITFLRMIEM